MIIEIDFYLNENRYCFARPPFVRQDRSIDKIGRVDAAQARRDAGRAPAAASELGRLCAHAERHVQSAAGGSGARAANARA